MINKFSILKQVDTEKLDKKIGQYRLENSKNKEPYLFMNNTTGEALAREVISDSIPLMPSIDVLKAMYPNAIIGEYKGCKIYENEDLAFGEVEIR